MRREDRPHGSTARGGGLQAATRLQHLTAEDAQILALEHGPIAGHTLKVAIAERPEAGGDPLYSLRERVAAGVAHAPRSVQRLAPIPLGIAPPAWVGDAALDVDAHVRRTPTTGTIDRDALLEIVATSMCERLDRDRPLWSIELVEGLEGDRVAYLLKIHHCMADGSAALRFASALLWGVAPAGAASGFGPRAATAPAPARGALLASGVRERVRGAAVAARGGARAAGSIAGWRAGTSDLVRAPATIRRELRSAPDASPFDAPIGRSRAAAFVSCSLDELKRVGHAAGGATINDLILAAIAGGLRGWLIRRGEAVPHLRVKVPVSMHHGDEGPAALGNRDSFFVVDLPLAEPDPLRRLEAVRVDTAERKRHHDADEMYVLFNDLSHLSRRAYRRANAIAGRPGVFSLCVSNVPGPRERLDVLGGAVRELHSLAEVGDRHGLRVSALSYAGTVSLGLCADRAAIGDLHLLADALEESVRELYEGQAG